MGAFGILYATYCIGRSIIQGTKDCIYDTTHRNRNFYSESGMYYDHHCVMRDVITNHPMSYETDYKGEVWLKDCKTGHYKKNITAERIERKFQIEKAKAEKGESDRSHIKYGDYRYDEDKFPGRRYKDFKTGKLYVIRRMLFEQEYYDMLHLWTWVKPWDEEFSVLVDPETGEMVRFTDATISNMIGQGALLEEINALFPIYKRDLERKMEDPDYDWVKRTMSNVCYYDDRGDALTDLFIDEQEAKVRRRREKNIGA